MPINIFLGFTRVDKYFFTTILLDLILIIFSMFFHWQFMLDGGCTLFLIIVLLLPMTIKPVARLVGCKLLWE